MKKNKGFIAISLIYSFFLVFLMTLLLIATNYAHNRILLSNVKKNVTDYLNGMSEFNPVILENRDYQNKEEVKIGSERWKVIKDNGTNVSLILNRNLTNMEIKSGLQDASLESAIQNNQVLMCYNAYITTFCNYTNTETYDLYTWNSSIVKVIVENWFNSDALLQKAISQSNLVEMTFSDGKNSNHSYVRIPLANEFDQIDDNQSSWYLTGGTPTNGMSTIQFGSTTVYAHNTYKTIRPVITVQKSTD